MLNKALFDRIGVSIAGVVVNKVIPEKFNKINKLIRAGFKKKNTPVIGVMPYQRRLDLPTVREIMEEVKVPLLCGDRNLDASVDKILIGAMEVRYALKYVENNSLLIIPADRIDMLEAAIKLQAKSKDMRKISGVVLTGNIQPNPGILNGLSNLQIPTLAIKTDTFTAAKKIDSIIVKVKPEDKEKIRLIVNMVEKYVDIDMILKNLT